jgi:hypothetical protein
LKKPNTKRAGGVAQGVGPVFTPQCQKKKKKPTLVEARQQWLTTVNCNPSYMRGYDLEEHGSRPAQAERSQDPISMEKSWEWCCTSVSPAMRILAQAGLRKM